MKYPGLMIFVALAGFGSIARADPAKLDVTIEGAKNGHFPIDSVACVADSSGKVGQTGKSISPGVAWTTGPAGTKSYALLMTDPDVPVTHGAPGSVTPADAPRQVLYHWILADIPVESTALAAGIGNNYSEVFGGEKIAISPDAGMNFAEYGYRGPCPPAGDLRPHHYNVRVFALDVAALAVPAPVEGKDFEALVAPHVLAEGVAVAAYATDPRVKY